MFSVKQLFGGLVLTLEAMVATIFLVETRCPNAAAQPIREQWLDGRFSPHTRSAYRADLFLFETWCEVRGTTLLRADAATLSAFSASRSTVGDSAATLRRRWSALSSFYRFALGSGAISANPVSEVLRNEEESANKRQTDIPTEESVAAYVEMAGELDARLAAMISLVVFDGVKLVDALLLDTTDVKGKPPKISLNLRRGDRTLLVSERSSVAIARCVGSRRNQPVFVSDHRAHTQKPERLSRFGADHLVRQLRYRQERITVNELYRYYLAQPAETTD